MAGGRQETADPRLAAVWARDAAADGRFLYSVKTTGVYCRPSCPSRRARAEHIRFHASPAEAEAAGFRPCLRCNPSAPSRAEANAALVAEACRLIDASEAPLNLEKLAAKVGLSPAYFHRLFRAETGLTPRDWAAAAKARRFRQALAGARVTEAIHAAGYGSTSRLYEQSKDILGMTPTRFQRGGRDEVIRFAVAETSLGALLVAESQKGIVAITLGDQPETLVAALERRFPFARLEGADAAFERRVAMVVGFVESPKLGLSLPLDLRGTAFQQRVWQALRQIPAGEVLSYAELAARIGAPKAVRAVAGACAANEVAVAVPCHRIVRADGALSGYRWGVERKRALLARETGAD